MLRISCLSHRGGSHPRLVRPLVALLPLVAVATLIAPGTAQAARPRSTVVSAPTAFTPLVVRPDLVIGLVSPRATYNQSQLLTGPGSAGRPIVLANADVVTFNRLAADSAYTFRVRNVTPGLTDSAWVTHSFRTAAAFLARPAAPTSLRLASSTATTVSVTWDPPEGTGPFSYEATYAGVPVTADCTIYCTDQELRTVTVAKPPAGSRAVFSVATRDGDFNLSLPAQLVIAG